MTVGNIAERSLEVIAKSCEVEVGRIDRMTSLESLELNSMKLLEIALVLQKEFGIVIDYGQLAEITTAGDVIDVVEGAVA